MSSAQFLLPFGEIRSGHGAIRAVHACLRSAGRLPLVCGRPRKAVDGGLGAARSENTCARDENRRARGGNGVASVSPLTCASFMPSADIGHIAASVGIHSARRVRGAANGGKANASRAIGAASAVFCQAYGSRRVASPANGIARVRILSCGSGSRFANGGHDVASGSRERVDPSPRLSIQVHVCRWRPQHCA